MVWSGEVTVIKVKQENFLLIESPPHVGPAETVLRLDTTAPLQGYAS
jgi:hypothetical protein